MAVAVLPWGFAVVLRFYVLRSKFYGCGVVELPGKGGAKNGGGETRVIRRKANA